MIEFYPEIKHWHMLLALCSGSLFLLRGLLVLNGRPVGNHLLLRYLSYGIDSLLLTLALMLLTMLHLNPLTQPWLVCKLSLLIAYVVLGVYALRRARTPRGRWLSFVAALCVFALMYGIARAHHPLGWLRLLGG